MSLFLNIQDNSPLTVAQRNDWYHDVAVDLKDAFIAKVTAGQREHGCDLGSYPMERLMDELQNELIDAMCYLAEIRRRMRESKVA